MKPTDEQLIDDEQEYFPRPLLKVEFLVEDDDMTDEEYATQPEREFVITDEMIREMIEENAGLKPGQTVCYDNLYVTLIKK